MPTLGVAATVIVPLDEPLLGNLRDPDRAGHAGRPVVAVAVRVLGVG